MRRSAPNSWVTNTRPNPQARLRLFCFPYAGGSTIIYRGWAEHLPPTVELWPVQLPGRGNRLREKPFTSMMPLVEAAALGITPLLDKPFAFFGHSMGAIIGFEMARLLREQRGIEPACLFASGSNPPQLKGEEKTTYNLPEAEFFEELRRLNGTPAEVLEHPELMQMMAPLLRADFETIQTYRYEPGAPPLNCPIVVMGGIQDEDISRENLEGWREHTRGSFSLRILPGDHFFINSQQQVITQIIAKALYESGALNPLS